MSDFDFVEVDFEVERVFAQGWDCGVRYYDEGRSLSDNPFFDERAIYFRMGFNRSRWIDRDFDYIDYLSSTYSEFS